jgi:hypothetical protein
MAAARDRLPSEERGRTVAEDTAPNVTGAGKGRKARQAPRTEKRSERCAPRIAEGRSERGMGCFGPASRSVLESSADGRNHT